MFRERVLTWHDCLPLTVHAGVAWRGVSLMQAFQLHALRLCRLDGRQSQFGALQPVAFLLQQSDGAVDLQGLQLRMRDGLTCKKRRQAGKWLALEPYVRDFAGDRRGAPFQRGQRQFLQCSVDVPICADAPR